MSPSFSLDVISRWHQVVGVETRFKLHTKLAIWHLFTMYPFFLIPENEIALSINPPGLILSEICTVRTHRSCIQSLYLLSYDLHRKSYHKHRTIESAYTGRQLWLGATLSNMMKSVRSVTEGQHPSRTVRRITLCPADMTGFVLAMWVHSFFFLLSTDKINCSYHFVNWDSHAWIIAISKTFSCNLRLSSYDL